MEHNKIARVLAMAAFSALLVAVPCVAEEATEAPGAGVPIDEAHFPDSALRQVVAEEDDDGNGILTRNESKYLSSLWLADTNVADLTGVELLDGVKSIYCNNTVIKSADLSGCIRLESFSAYDCPYLTELTLPATLTDLDVSGCAFTAIDVSGCPSLETLSVENNNLTKLDVTNCTELTSLSVSDNRLTELDVTACPWLEYLYANNNKLTGLDFSAQNALHSVHLDNNSFAEIADFTGWQELTNLSLDGNNLTALTVTDCPALEDLSCSDNKLAELTVTGCPELDWFSAYSNKLKAADLSTCPKLTRSNVLVDDECIVKYGSLLGYDWKILLLALRVVVGICAAIAGIVWLVRLINDKAKTHR